MLAGRRCGTARKTPEPPESPRIATKDTVIKLFISDIDGCLATAYCAYDLRSMQTLADYAAAAGEIGADEARPAFTLCSGRPYSYVEAMTQVLGVRLPVLFEAGGGLFDPVAARITWNPTFTEEAAAQMQEVARWMQQEVVPGTSMSLDFGKKTQAGIVGPDADEVARQASVVREFVAARFPDFVVFDTEVSIDVLHRDVTKRQALDWLGERLGVTLNEMAYVGDTNGDLEALKAVGFSFAPANATDAVKAAVQVVTPGRVIEGVLAAYRWCLAHNEARLGLNVEG